MSIQGGALSTQRVAMSTKGSTELGGVLSIQEGVLSTQGGALSAQGGSLSNQGGGGHC